MLPTPLQRVGNAACFWVGLIFAAFWLFNTVIPDPRHSPPSRRTSTPISSRHVAPQPVAPAIAVPAGAPSQQPRLTAVVAAPVEVPELTPFGLRILQIFGAIGVTMMAFASVNYLKWKRAFEYNERHPEQIHPSRRKADTSLWGRLQKRSERFIAVPLEEALMCAMAGAMFVGGFVVGASTPFLGALFVAGPCVLICVGGLMGAMYFPAAAFDKAREQERRDEEGR